MVSSVERYKEEYAILNVDMLSAFDIIDSAKLIEICKTFLDQDDIKLTLLANTSASIFSGNKSMRDNIINIIIGIPHGDKQLKPCTLRITS